MELNQDVNVFTMQDNRKLYFIMIHQVTSQFWFESDREILIRILQAVISVFGLLLMLNFSLGWQNVWLKIGKCIWSDRRVSCDFLDILYMWTCAIMLNTPNALLTFNLECWLSDVVVLRLRERENDLERRGIVVFKNHYHRSTRPLCGERERANRFYVCRCAIASGSSHATRARKCT